MHERGGTMNPWNPQGFADRAAGARAWPLPRRRRAHRPVRRLQDEPAPH